MNCFRITRWSIIMSFLFSSTLQAQSDQPVKVSFNNLDTFREPGKNWVVAADAQVDPNTPNDMKPVKGEGVLVNTFSKNDRMHLYSKEEFGDLRLELDFMMAKNSNSGIYFQGRYEIQLLDSWTKLVPTSGDLGGIYTRWNAQRGNYEGTPPVMNVAKAPGLWQHLSITFRAPVFDDKGVKITNARFEEVYLNGVLVQQEALVTGPTGSSMFQDEKATGPLVIQGDHGQVAIKNMTYQTKWSAAKAPQGDQYWIPNSTYWETISPMIVTPASKPSFIKTFLMYGDKKLTHVLSVGNPNEVNYSYDVKQGAIFQIWRGQFLDLAMSWRDRGGMQLAKPLGSVVKLSDAPVLAVLADERAAWPDSIPFDNMMNEGYVLDKQRSPKFAYSLNGMKVTDSIFCQPNGEGINRTIAVANAPSGLYQRIAEGKNVANLGNGLYAVNDKSYYIRLDKNVKPVIRPSATGQEMIVKYNAGNPLTYSIIW